MSCAPPLKAMTWVWKPQALQPGAVLHSLESGTKYVVGSHLTVDDRNRLVLSTPMGVQVGLAPGPHVQLAAQGIPAATPVRYVGTAPVGVDWDRRLLLVDRQGALLELDQISTSAVRARSATQQAIAPHKARTGCEFHVVGVIGGPPTETLPEVMRCEPCEGFHCTACGGQKWLRVKVAGALGLLTLHPVTPAPAPFPLLIDWQVEREVAPERLADRYALSDDRYLRRRQQELLDD